MPVIDASVVVAALTGGEYTDWAEEQLSPSAAGRSLWAPHLIDAEVGHSLRRLVVARELRDKRASEALGRFALLPLRRIHHMILLDRAWQLRHNFSFYDSLYVSLAEQLGAPLLTLDMRLAKATAATAGVDVRAIAPAQP